MNLVEREYIKTYIVKSTKKFDWVNDEHRMIKIHRFVVAAFSDEPIKMLSKTIFTWKIIDQQFFNAPLSVFTPTCKSWSGELNSSIVNYGFELTTPVLISPYLNMSLIFETENNCDVDIMFHIVGFERSTT